MSHATSHFVELFTIELLIALEHPEDCVLLSSLMLFASEREALEGTVETTAE